MNSWLHSAAAECGQYDAMHNTLCIRISKELWECSQLCSGCVQVRAVFFYLTHRYSKGITKCPTERPWNGQGPSREVVRANSRYRGLLSSNKPSASIFAHVVNVQTPSFKHRLHSV